MFDFWLTQTPCMQVYTMNTPLLLSWSTMKGCISLKLKNLCNSNVSITRTIFFFPWSFELLRLLCIYSDDISTEKFRLYVSRRKYNDALLSLFKPMQTNSKLPTQYKSIEIPRNKIALIIKHKSKHQDSNNKISKGSFPLCPKTIFNKNTQGIHLSWKLPTEKKELHNL